MFNRLDAIEKKFKELNLELVKPEVLNDFNKLKELSKEQSDLKEIVDIYEQYKKVKDDLKQAKDMENDPDLKEMALMEMANLEEEEQKLYHQLEILLVPKDENDGKNVIMEIRGAAGGDEANIFAGDLFRMYSYYADKNNWKIEVVHAIEGASGGFAQIEFLVKGSNVYSKLKYESGSHRVQRVPETEAQGRVHTSTATVLVMPEFDEIGNVEIKDTDIKVDVFHSSGAGGQSVNTANSAVRITHIPTGIVVGCQTERSQLRNKERALNLLKIKILDEQKRAQEGAMGEERKSKIGTGDRSEKIRTYNYPQNRVTDHRIGFSTMTLDRVMDGELEPIIEALITEDLKLKLAGENFD